jgi:polyferredoxin
MTYQDFLKIDKKKFLKEKIKTVLLVYFFHYIVLFLVSVFVIWLGTLFMDKTFINLLIDSHQFIIPIFLFLIFLKLFYKFH